MTDQGAFSQTDRGSYRSRLNRPSPASSSQVRNSPFVGVSAGARQRFHSIRPACHQDCHIQLMPRPVLGVSFSLTSPRESLWVRHFRCLFRLVWEEYSARFLSFTLVMSTITKPSITMAETWIDTKIQKHQSTGLYRVRCTVCKVAEYCIPYSIICASGF